MWKNCGVIKDRYLLNNGLEQLKNIKSKLDNVDIRIDEYSCADLQLIFDLRSSLVSAEATILSALAREESRGAHQRSDFKDLDQSCKSNYLVEMNQSDQKLKLSNSPLKTLTEPLQKILDGASREVDFKNKLLE